MFKDELLNLLKSEVIPTMGCTDPGAIALTAAYARSVSPGDIRSLQILVSSAICKNARSVGIPKMQYRGVEVAALLGISLDNPILDLTIFSTMTDRDIARAIKLKSHLPVDLMVSDDLPDVYVEISLTTSEGEGRAIVEHRHNNLVYLRFNEKIFTDRRPLKSVQKEKVPSLKRFSLEDIISATLEIPVSSLDFLLEGMELNIKVAKEGMKSRTGLQIGSALGRVSKKSYVDQNLGSQMAAYTAAACDARMSGVTLPIMSSAGSGNQGLTVIIPIAVAAESLESERDKTIYALAISHLVTIYVKEATGRLAPICGCGVAAGAGASAGLTYLLGGGINDISRAVTIVISTMAGMICDGAKEGCALKLWAGVSIAWQAALLAREGFDIPAGSGIVGSSVQETLENLEKISRQAMKQVNKTLLSCFLH